MGDMKTAYQLAAVAVRQRWQEQHPKELAILDGMSPTEISIIKGVHDSVQEIFECLGTKYTMDKVPGEAKISFLNCASSFNEDIKKTLKRRVEGGLYLASSDWSLLTVQQLFPGMVQYNAKNTGDEVVSVEPSLESLWSEVVVLGADPQWWLEGSSYCIDVKQPEKVRIEAASHDLLVKYGSPVVAVDFPWERGRVFHVLSHFWHKRSRTPAERYRGPCVDFLSNGLKLSEASIEKVFAQAKISKDAVNFAELQSASTATELVVQLCVRAKRGF